MKLRCEWAMADPLLMQYHDEEWGVPEHDDRRLFELLVLGGAQAGLSWLTILRKRDSYRKAFDGFDVRLIAEYDERKVAELLLNAGIVRNRLKIEATIQNARAFLKIQQEFGSFDNVKKATVDQLTQVEGMSEKVALALRKWLDSDEVS